MLRHVLVASLAATIVAQQPSRVHGRVFDERGAPLAGVAVGVTTGPDGPLAMSAADGAFGFAATMRHGTEAWLGGGGFARVTLAIGDDGDVGDVTLERAAQIAGWVRGEAGNPVAGATVIGVDGMRHGPDWLDYKGDPNSPANRCYATTDARGAFLLRDAVRGVAAVFASGPGIDSVGPVVVAPGEAVELIVRVHPGRAAARPPRRCTVRAVDAATGAPIPAFSGAELSTNAPPTLAARTVARALATASDGALVFEPVRPQRSVEVRAPGCARTRLELTDGDLTARLLPEILLRGDVHDPDDGTPVAGAHVRVAMGSVAASDGDEFATRAPFEAISDAQGRFEVRGLGPGEWTLLATHPTRRAGPRRVVALAAAATPEALRLACPRAASLAVAVRGTPRDARWRLRVVPVLPGFSSLRERAIDGSVRAVEGRHVFHGLPAGACEVELLVPQPPRLGGPRKLVVATARVEDGATANVDVALDRVELQTVTGRLELRGAAPPLARLVVALEPDHASPMRVASLFVAGPAARPAADGTFALLAEPANHTLLVVDAATRLILARRDGVVVDGGGTRDLGAVEVHTRVLTLAVDAAAAAAVERVEIRAPELWPAGVGRMVAPVGLHDTGGGVPVRAGRPLLPVWVPQCELVLLPRPALTEVRIAVPGGTAPEVTARVALQ
jgi:hypothetical protein